MGEIKLSREADALICVVYKDYLERRKSGASKFDAKMFAGSAYIHENLLPKWSFTDIDETCRELSRARLLDCLFGDDVVCEAALSDDAIIYMENRFKNGVASLFGYLEKLRSLIPW